MAASGRGTVWTSWYPAENTHHLPGLTCEVSKDLGWPEANLHPCVLCLFPVKVASRSGRLTRPRQRKLQKLVRTERTSETTLYNKSPGRLKIIMKEQTNISEAFCSFCAKCFLTTASIEENLRELHSSSERS